MTSLLKRYGGSLLLIILAFSYATRMYKLHVPEKYMFDEVYHAMTAKLIAHNDPRAFEWWNDPPEPDTSVDWLHPPLAKYFQAASMLGFGENSFGWRFSSVLFGVLSIVLVYHLALYTTKKESVALTAAAIASLDGLLLVQSRIAMNDIHVTFFILLSLLWYLRYRKNPSLGGLLLTGIISGLALASKWSGLFGLVIIWFFEVLSGLQYLASKKWNLQNNWQQILNKVSIFLVLLIVVPLIVYILSYWQMFAQGKDWNHFKELHQQIWHYQTNLSETHPYQSRPWQWALNTRPVWYHVEYENDSRGDIYAFGNPVIFWVGLAVVMYRLYEGSAFTLLAYKKSNSYTALVKRVLKAATTSPSFFLVVAYFAVWLPWQFSPRIMFFYHYTPAVPLLSILLAIQLVTWYYGEKWKSIFAVSVSILMVLAFAVWYPHWTGMIVSNDLKDSLYFMFATWK